jgi:drug/metabolite transporter superfamily protein YnfA
VNKSTSILVLVLAAILEAGGDALIRTGLERNSLPGRFLFFALGAVVLFAYGWTVNAPPWDFGRLLGLYVVFFFVSAQFIGWIVFEQVPSGGTLWGGLLIIAGGAVIMTSQQ